ncbi:hypothetical protein DRO66_06375 [Candidatus Bathyarchaeota archaeon]|nr:MAG: hypothetical protein DRO66_06375 [Candidatus Bathyarchaeota archaeon]
MQEYMKTYLWRVADDLGLDIEAEFSEYENKIVFESDGKNVSNYYEIAKDTCEGVIRIFPFKGVLEIFRSQRAYKKNIRVSYKIQVMFNERSVVVRFVPTSFYLKKDDQVSSIQYLTYEELLRATETLSLGDDE